MHNPILWRDLFILALALLLILFVIVLVILTVLRHWLRRSRATPCAEIPEAVGRQPDPCLYSQSFLMQFFPGQPVTWDNPDISLTEVDGTPVSSAVLQPGHNYYCSCENLGCFLQPCPRDVGAVQLSWIRVQLSRA